MESLGQQLPGTIETLHVLPSASVPSIWKITQIHPKKSNLFFSFNILETTESKAGPAKTLVHSGSWSLKGTLIYLNSDFPWFSHVWTSFFFRQALMKKYSTKQLNQPLREVCCRATGFASHHESPDTSVPSSSKKASKKGFPWRIQARRAFHKTLEHTPATINRYLRVWGMCQYVGHFLEKCLIPEVHNQRRWQVGYKPCRGRGTLGVRTHWVSSHLANLRDGSSKGFPYEDFIDH